MNYNLSFELLYYYRKYIIDFLSIYDRYSKYNCIYLIIKLYVLFFYR